MKTIKTLVILIIVVFMAVVPIWSHQLSVPAYPGTEPGEKSLEMERIQQRLKNWGYYEYGITGTYDYMTQAAVERFQYSYGLPVNGIIDHNTMVSMGLMKSVYTNTAYAQDEGTSDEQLMARAINGEARGESYEGQVAVGAVILNRTRNAEFPNTISGVIYQPLAFTAVADGQINVPIEEGSSVVEAARDALNGWDPTNGCLYYWNPATATSKWIWTRQIVKKIGKHNFGI